MLESVSKFFKKAPSAISNFGNQAISETTQTFEQIKSNTESIIQKADEVNSDLIKSSLRLSASIFAILTFFWQFSCSFLSGKN